MHGGRIKNIMAYEVHNNMANDNSRTSLERRFYKVTGADTTELRNAVNAFNLALMDMLSKVGTAQSNAASAGDVATCSECAKITDTVCGIIKNVTDNFLCVEPADGTVEQPAVFTTMTRTGTENASIMAEAGGKAAVNDAVGTPVAHVVPVAQVDKSKDVNSYLLPSENIDAVNEDRELYLVDTEPLAVNETDGGDAGGNSIPPAINFDMEDFGSAPTASPVAAEKDEHNAANAENVAAEKNEHTAAGNADDAADADDGMVSLESLMGEFGISDFGADFH